MWFCALFILQHMVLSDIFSLWFCKKKKKIPNIFLRMWVGREMWESGESSTSFTGSLPKWMASKVRIEPVRSQKFSGVQCECWDPRTCTIPKSVVWGYTSFLCVTCTVLVLLKRQSGHWVLHMPRSQVGCLAPDSGFRVTQTCTSSRNWLK